MVKFGTEVPWGKISPEVEAEETLNDSDKTISVPSDEEWKILSIRVEYTATATVGTRQFKLEIRDGDNDVIYEVTNFPITASQIVLCQYLASVGYWDETDITYYGTNIRRLESLPDPTILKAGWDIRIRDMSAIDAAADDMIIQIIVKKRKV